MIPGLLLLDEPDVCVAIGCKGFNKTACVFCVFPID